MSKTNPATDADQFDINESAYKTSHTAVRKARRFAMQGLYEWLMTDRRFEQTDHREWKANAPHDIAARTRANNAMHTVHLGYYHELMRHIPEQVEELDALIAQHLDREIGLIDPVEHAILLVGVYELKDRFEIPYKVVLDEAMKLNTHFGATDAHKLINAVLDKLAPELRELEVAADEKLPKVAKAAKPAPVAEVAPQETVADTASDVEPVDAEADTTPKREPKPRIGLKSGQPIKRKRVAPSTATAKAASTVTDSAEVTEQPAAEPKLETEIDPASIDPTSIETTSLKEALLAAGTLASDSVAEQPQEEAVESKTDAEVADTTDAKKPDAE
ncbi:transcription antitermination factor NusB [Psychrobacter arenosus]|uniref:transcription antitermination factor NusB n=1 Tax=Psychrobacter arenosus TaxID=256326 RepID=UPI001917CADE|nr:transcription antitermination factor NusB [Psychrobacter arenosus]